MYSNEAEQTRYTPPVKAGAMFTSLESFRTKIEDAVADVVVEKMKFCG